MTEKEYDGWECPICKTQNFMSESSCSECCYTMVEALILAEKKDGKSKEAKGSKRSGKPLCKFGPGGEYVREYEPKVSCILRRIWLLIMLIYYKHELKQIKKKRFDLLNNIIKLWLEDDYNLLIYDGNELVCESKPSNFKNTIILKKASADKQE